jgi:hypothetical protein
MKLISIFKSPTIEFLCDERYWKSIPEPSPSNKNMPEWYKKIPAYSDKFRDGKGGPMPTAKKCMPMIDAMAIGYTIPFMQDLYVKVDKDCKVAKGPDFQEFGAALEFHHLAQVSDKENNSPFGKSQPLKFINPWVVKTSPGWSTLFVPCINSLENRFQLLGGLVDTDKYVKQVNFPGRWILPNYEGYIRAGTPMMTAIPIKRDTIDIKHNIRQLTQDELLNIHRISKSQMTRDGVYQNEQRVNK